MTNEGRQEVVAEELAAAEEELRGARQLISVDLFRIAMTRVYFAADLPFPSRPRR